MVTDLKPSAVPPGRWQAPVIPNVVRQYAEDAAFLHATRTGLVAGANVSFQVLRRFDDRLAAHLDGLSVARDDAWPYCEAALELASPGAMFTATVVAIQERQPTKLNRLLALAEAVPSTRKGLISAFGWVGREWLQGTVANLLAVRDPFKRMVAFAACSTHRVDPGLLSARPTRDPSPLVRARALRITGELGCQELEPECAAAHEDDDPECRFWGIWSSVLLGKRGSALDKLVRIGAATGPHRERALRLALQAMSTGAAHEVLQHLARDPTNHRSLIVGSGIVGDPSYVPWLIRQMEEESAARLAGEAFALITGADLESARLTRPRPEAFESGPNDNPEDPNVEQDPDDGLPWPDPERVTRWWQENGAAFSIGARYFLGSCVTLGHCRKVLETGAQRQRKLAAHYVCLLETGTVLFNTSAPAWRQQRLLARMG